MICFILATTISTTVSLTTIEYSENFTSGLTPTAQCAKWKTFLADLPAQNYTLLKIYGSNNQVGLSIHDPIVINNIIKALKSSTSYGPITSNGASWVVGTCGGMELAANNTICQCQNPGYSVRPCITNGSYGGIGTNTCNGPSQTMNVMLQYY